MTSPRKILAIKLRSLGDTVLMTPALDRLKEAFPQAEIHAAVLAPWAPLLEDHPAIDRIWPYERHRERAARAKAAARLALKLRKERFDCVVNFHASPSSAMVSFATGAKLRSIHFHGHHDRNRYSTVALPGKGVLKPIIERDLDAVRALGVPIPEGLAGKMPSLRVSSHEGKWAADFSAKLGAPVMALGIGSSRPSKGWPLERFADLAIAWCRQRRGSALALVAPGEERLRTEFLKAVDDALGAALADPTERAAVRGRISTESRLKIRELAAFLGAAAVFVGNDSGPRHVAVAMGTPTVTLFGPEHPFEWHPYPQESHPYFFVENLACRRDASPGMPPWCALDLCVEEQHKCMRLIGTDAVLEKCLEISARAEAQARG